MAIRPKNERETRNQETTVQNWFAIETEAEFRRQEWERAVAADAQAASVQADHAKRRWLRLPHVAFVALKRRRIAMPGLPFSMAIAPRFDDTCQSSPAD